MDESAAQLGEITETLKVCNNGNREAMAKLVPLVYEKLRHQAHRYLNRERSNHTLQTTGLAQGIFEYRFKAFSLNIFLFF